MSTLHAKITAYKGNIVCELIADKSIDGEVATSLDIPTNIGQVIMNTAEHLGVSPEALELLKSVKVGHDSIGDVDWFRSDDGKDNFGWIGGPYAVVTAATAEAARGFAVDNRAYQPIPNDVPAGAIEYIDSL